VAKKKLTKAEKAQQALMELLAEDAPELIEVHKQKQARIGNIQEVSEEEIQEFREAQGIIYFLKAPQLFKSKICNNCGNHFIVSRLYVASCSYHCIAAELLKLGIVWKKHHDVEALVQSVYEGNEPIWINNLDRLRKALEMLHSDVMQATESSGEAASPEVNSISPKLIKL
jgi:hypothetical protein